MVVGGGGFLPKVRPTASHYSHIYVYYCKSGRHRRFCVNYRLDDGLQKTSTRVCVDSRQYLEPCGVTYAVYTIQTC